MRGPRRTPSKSSPSPKRRWWSLAAATLALVAPLSVSLPSAEARVVRNVRTVVAQPAQALLLNTAGGARPVSVNGFQHPGILNNAASLQQLRADLTARQPLRTAAYESFKRSRYASLSWNPRPVARVGCGSRNSPDEGCTAEMDDAQAAYAHALLWHVTGDRAHAEKSKQILDAWARTLVEHRFDTVTYKNGRLQAAWAAQTFTRAAELVRHSDARWPAADVQRFEGMLRSAFLPLVRDGWIGGGANWQLSMADATTSIGVFLSDRAVFEDGISDWRAQLPAAVYLSSDGASPRVPPGTVIKSASLTQYWRNPTRYIDGLSGETCRDAAHAAMGFAAALSTAETARLQKVDLYGEQRNRLVAGMELNARFINNPRDAAWPCSAPLQLGGEAWRSTWEVGYRHYAARQGVAMPQTQRLLSGIRPTPSMLFMNWETLTHGAPR